MLGLGLGLGLVARDVPVVALEELLADEQPQPVRAAARHHVRHLVDHEHLARAELVCDARRARAAHGLPRAGQVALDAG